MSIAHSVVHVIDMLLILFRSLKYFFLLELVIESFVAASEWSTGCLSLYRLSLIILTGIVG